MVTTFRQANFLQYCNSVTSQRERKFRINLFARSWISCRAYSICGIRHWQCRFVLFLSLDTSQFKIITQTIMAFVFLLAMPDECRQLLRLCSYSYFCLLWID